MRKDMLKIYDEFKKELSAFEDEVRAHQEERRGPDKDYASWAKARVEKTKRHLLEMFAIHSAGGYP